ncbi:MAG: hypothetical protein AAFZ01_00565 [Pseudomonadota bacterium]
MTGPDAIQTHAFVGFSDPTGQDEAIILLEMRTAADQFLAHVVRRLVEAFIDLA